MTCAINTFDNMFFNDLKTREIIEAEREKKISEYMDNIDDDIFEDAMRNADPDEYQLLFNAYKANDQQMLMDSTRSLLSAYCDFINQEK